MQRLAATRRDHHRSAAVRSATICVSRAGSTGFTTKFLEAGVEAALADHGVEVDRVPLTSARIFELLRMAAGRAAKS